MAILISTKLFNPKKTFENGQVFLYHKVSSDKYIAINKQQACLVSVQGEQTGISSLCGHFSEESWLDYFDLNLNYTQFNASFPKEKAFQNILKKSEGMKILNQDPFLVLLSFLLSANNNIKRITKTVLKLSEDHGQFLGHFYEKKVYAFPEPEALHDITIDMWRKIYKVGYRDRYLFFAVQKWVHEGPLIENLKTMDDHELFNELLTWPGIGTKVASCIMLFGFHRLGMTPIDTWIKKYLNDTFGLKGSQKKLERFFKEKYGPYSGLAQQYIFYDMIHKEIKKEVKK